jgi:hypothetical protein
MPQTKPIREGPVALWLRRLEAAAIFLPRSRSPPSSSRASMQVEHLLTSLGPSRCRLRSSFFAVVASAPFSVTDALAIMNGVLFGPMWGSIVNAVGIVLAAVDRLRRRAAHVATARHRSAIAVKRLPRGCAGSKSGSPMFLIVRADHPGAGRDDRNADGGSATRPDLPSNLHDVRDRRSDLHRRSRSAAISSRTTSPACTSTPAFAERICEPPSLRLQLDSMPHQRRYRCQASDSESPTRSATVSDSRTCLVDTPAALAALIVRSRARPRAASDSIPNSITNARSSRI